MAGQHRPPTTLPRSRTPKPALDADTYAFLGSHSSVANHIRRLDWAGTAVGPMPAWPPALKAALGIVLNSAFPMCIWWGKHEMTHFYNDAYAQILSDRHPAALGQPAAEVWSDIWEQVEPLATEVFRTGKPILRKNMQLFIQRHGQPQETYFTFSNSPLTNEAGQVAGLIGVITETTEEVLARQQLSKHQAQMDAIFQAVVDGIAVFDMDQNMILLNEALANMNGFSSVEAMKQNVASFARNYRLTLPDGTPVPVENWPISRTLRGESFTDCELRGKRLDIGREWFFNFSGVPVYDSGGKQILAVSVTRDITARKQAEAEVQASEERFRTLANNISQLAWMAEPDGTVFWYNQRWYDYTGSTPQSMAGRGWERVHHPEHKKRVVNTFMQHLRAGTAWEDTFPLLGSDGMYRWFLMRAIPIRDASGTIIRWLGTNTDIDDLRTTTQRNTELETITAALKEQQAQLLALNHAKDEFISLASHQLRTPATGVKQYLGMLLENYAGELSEKQRDFVERANASNERQLHIVSDLLSIAQADAGKIHLYKQPTDLQQFVQIILHEQADKFRTRQQRVTYTHPKQACLATIDAERMRMALENIIDNASKYTPEGQTIRIRLFRQGKTAFCLTVQDSGVGIAQKDIAKIFHKFVRVDNTLSMTAGGSGLGLYLAQKIVELHGGTITVASKLHHGSTFTITLPVGKVAGRGR